MRNPRVGIRSRRRTLGCGAAGDNEHRSCSARRMPRVLQVLAASAVLVLPSLGAGPPPSPPVVVDINLAAAREALVVAQEHLRVAGSGKPDEYGGHRKLALELVNTALEQVDAGLRIAAEEEAARRAKEAAAQPASKRKRRK